MCYLNDVQVNPICEVHWFLYEPGAYTARVELGEMAVEFEIEVVASVVSIRYISGQTKTEYYAGEAFDFEGMQFEATLSDGSQRMITSIEELKEIDNYYAIMWVNSERIYDGTLRIGDNNIHLELYDFFEIEGIDDPEEIFVFTVTEAPGIKGDVDEDNELTIIDVRLLLQEIVNAGLNTSWPRREKFFLDYSNDNIVDVIDVRLLLQEIVN